MALPDLEHLRTFVTVCRTGSLTEAAALLGVLAGPRNSRPSRSCAFRPHLPGIAAAPLCDEARTESPSAQSFPTSAVRETLRLPSLGVLCAGAAQRTAPLPGSTLLIAE